MSGRVVERDVDECLVLEQVTLDRLAERGVPAAERTGGATMEVTVEVLGPREVPLQKPVRESLAQVLANRTIERLASQPGGPGASVVSSKCHWSDDTDSGERCYRIVLQMSVPASPTVQM